MVIDSVDDGDTDGVDNADWHVYNGLDNSFLPVTFTFLVAILELLRR
jgi:hypothetical protein